MSTAVQHLVGRHSHIYIHPSESSHCLIQKVTLFMVEILIIGIIGVGVLFMKLEE